jgi:mRNA-degrading endonuclease YafQ of YafQ-DinJ toxin-antitoxin module
MKIIFHRKFAKQFKKLPQKTREQFYERLTIFEIDPFNPVLNNHCVHHPYEGCQSINIGGDVRALFEINNDSALFIRVGSHSELYK